MDCKTGRIYTSETAIQMSEFAKQFEQQNNRKLLPLSDTDFNEIKDMPEPRRKNYMRNHQCVCGSGKKFKKCCWSKYS